MSQEFLSQEEIDSVLRGVFYTAIEYVVSFDEHEYEYIMAVLKSMPYDQVHLIMRKLETSYRRSNNEDCT